jgi:DNA-binding transcriptional MerR regulator
LLTPVVPVRAVCDELHVSRKTFRVWERGGVVPSGATIEYNGVRYVFAHRLEETLNSIARHRAGTRGAAA